MSSKRTRAAQQGQGQGQGQGVGESALGCFARGEVLGCIAALTLPSSSFSSSSGSTTTAAMEKRLLVNRMLCAFLRDASAVMTTETTESRTTTREDGDLLAMLFALEKEITGIAEWIAVYGGSGGNLNSNSTASEDTAKINADNVIAWYNVAVICVRTGRLVYARQLLENICSTLGKSSGDSLLYVLLPACFLLLELITRNAHWNSSFPHNLSDVSEIINTVQTQISKGTGDFNSNSSGKGMINEQRLLTILKTRFALAQAMGNNNLGTGSKGVTLSGKEDPGYNAELFGFPIDQLVQTGRPSDSIALAMNIPSMIFAQSQSEFLKGNYTNAFQLLIKLTNKTTEGHATNNDTSVEIAIMNNLACIHRAEGKNQLAFLLLSKAAEIAEAHSFPVFEIMVNMGTQSMLNENFPLALQCFRKAIQYRYDSPKLWLRMSECVIRSRRSRLLNSSNRVIPLPVEDGIQAAENCLFLLDLRTKQSTEDSGAFILRIHALLCHSWLSLEGGFFSAALGSALKTIELFSEKAQKQDDDSSMISSLSTAYSYTAEALAKMGRPKEALEFGKKAYDTLAVSPSGGGGAQGSAKKKGASNPVNREMKRTLAINTASLLCVNSQFTEAISALGLATSEGDSAKAIDSGVEEAREAIRSFVFTHTGKRVSIP